MFLPIPLRAETTHPARPPLATIVLLVLNVLVFAVTSRTDNAGPAAEESRLERIADWELEKLGARDPGLQRVLDNYPTALAFVIAEQDRWRKRFDGETVALFERLLGDVEAVRSAHPFYGHGLVPAEVSLRTLVSSMFLHADLLHLGFNMLFLWVTAGLLENDWGRARFAAAYLGFGIIAGLTFVAMNPTGIEPAVGASGAVAGTMGAFAVLHARARIQLALVYGLGLAPRIRLATWPAWPLLLAWILQQLYFASLLGDAKAGIAFSAHIGGFAAGALTGTAILMTRRKLRPAGANLRRR